MSYFPSSCEMSDCDRFWAHLLWAAIPTHLKEKEVPSGLEDYVDCVYGHPHSWWSSLTGSAEGYQKD